MTQWFGQLVLSSMGLAAAGVLVVLIRLCWRRDPISCYRMLVVLLVAALALPVLQISIQGRAAGVTPAGEQFLAKVWWTETSTPVEQAETAVVPEAADSFEEGADSPQELLSMLRALDDSNVSGPRVDDTAEEDFDPEDVALSPAVDVPGTEADATRPILTADAETEPIVRGRDWSAWPLAPWLAVAWLLGVLYFGAWHAARIARTMALIRRGRPLTSTRLLELWRWVTLGRHRRVRLIVSAEISSPACWGILRPVLMLPAHDVDHTDESVLEWAMRHELVHIRRGDARTAAIQSLLTTLFWFHPVAWWLSAQLDRMRELSCDDLVVRCSGKRRSYALALLDYAGGRDLSPTESPAPAHGALVPWSGSASQLRRRIKMLEKTRTVRGVRDRLVAWTSVATMLATLWSGQLAIAATLIPAPQEEPQSAPEAPCVCEEECEEEAPTTAPELAIAIAPEDVIAPEKVVAPEAVVAPEDQVFALAADDFGLAVAASGRAFPGQGGLTAMQRVVCDRRIGVKLMRVSEALASHLGVSTEGTLLIDGVADGSPADEAGIKRHDVLVSVDRKRPVTVTSLRDAIRSKSLGDEVRLGIVRGCKEKVVEVEITNWQGDGFWAQPLKPGPGRAGAPRSSAGVFGGRPQARGSNRKAPPTLFDSRSKAKRPSRAPSVFGGGIKGRKPRSGFFQPGSGDAKPDRDDDKELKRTLDSLEKTRKGLQKYIDKLERELREIERKAERDSKRRRPQGRRSRSRRTTQNHDEDIEKLKKRMRETIAEAPKDASPEAVRRLQATIAGVEALNAQQQARAAQLETILNATRHKLEAGRTAIDAETEARIRAEYDATLQRLRAEKGRLEAERARLAAEKAAATARWTEEARRNVEKSCKESAAQARRLYSEAQKTARRVKAAQAKKQAEIKRNAEERLKKEQKAHAREHSNLARELARSRTALGAFARKAKKAPTARSPRRTISPRKPRPSAAPRPRRNAIEFPSPPPARTAPAAPRKSGAGPVQKHEHHHYHEHIHRIAPDGDDDVRTRTQRIELSLRDLQSRLDREGRELAAARIAGHVDGCKADLDPEQAQLITAAVSDAVAGHIRVTLDRKSQKIVLTMPDREEVDAAVRACLRECAPKLKAADEIVDAVHATTAREGKLVGIAIESLAPAKRAAIDAVQTGMDRIESDIRKLASETRRSSPPRAAENDRKSVRLE